MNGIYTNEWYNRKIATKQEYINNKKSILLGTPRLRQMRIKKGNEAETSQVLSDFLNCEERGLVSKETVVLRRWGSDTRKFGLSTELIM